MSNCLIEIHGEANQFNKKRHLSAETLDLCEMLGSMYHTNLHPELKVQKRAKSDSNDPNKSEMVRLWVAYKPSRPSRGQSSTTEARVPVFLNSC